MDGIRILTQLASVSNQVGGKDPLHSSSMMKRCKDFFFITGFFHEGDVCECEKSDTSCSVRV